MAFPSLAEYLETLHRAGDLHRVEAEVSRDAQPAVIADRAYHRRTPAVLLGNLTGCEFPLATLLAGKSERISRICAGRTPGQLANELDAMLKTAASGTNADGWLGRLGVTSSGDDADRFAPRLVKSAECQQVVRLGRDIDVGRLPLIGWEESSNETPDPADDMHDEMHDTPDRSDDETAERERKQAQQRGPVHDPTSARWLPVVELFYRAPGSDVTLVTRASLVVDPQRYGARQAVLFIEPFDPLVELVQQCRRSGQALPLGVVLGGDPAGLVALHIPQFVRHDVIRMTGLLRGKRRELVNARQIELAVPTDADFVLEAIYEPGESDHDFTSSEPTRPDLLRHMTPIPVGLQAVTHRANPVGVLMPLDVRDGYSLAINEALPMSNQPIAGNPISGNSSPDDGGQRSAGGASINEAIDLRRAMFRVAMPLLRRLMPELVDLHLPMYDEVRYTAFVAIRTYYPGQAKRVIAQLRGLVPLMPVRMLVVVDEDVELRRHDELWQAVSRHADPGRDLIPCAGPIDPYALAGAEANAAGEASQTMRLAIDATRKPTRGNGSTSPDRPIDSRLLRRVMDRWSEFGLG